MGREQRGRWERGTLSASLGGCLAAGLVAAAGHAGAALAVAALLLGGLVVVGERRRMVPLLWCGAALTAPMNGVRISVLLAVSDVVLVAALAATLPDVLRRPRRRIGPPGLVVAAAVLLGAGLVGTFFAQDAGASLATMAKVVLAAGGSVTALVLWDPGRRRLRQLAWAWLAGACLSAVVGLVLPRPVLGRAVGLTTHPNHFGLVCLLGVGLGIGLALSSPPGRLRWAALAATGLLTVGVGVSGSRSAVLGLAVAVAASAALTKRLRLLVATGIAVLLVGMAVAAGLVHVPSSHALARLGGDAGTRASDAERHETLSVALGTIDRHPFTGEGFQFAQAAHSIYLQALVVGGPVALAAFLWVCWTIGWAGVLAARSGRGDSPLAAGLTAGLAGYLASGTFDNILWDRYLWTYLGLLVVLAATLRQAPDTAAQPSSAPRPDAPADGPEERPGPGWPATAVTFLARPRPRRGGGAPRLTSGPEGPSRA